MKLYNIYERSSRPQRQDDIVKFAVTTERARQDLNQVMKNVDELQGRVGKIIERMNDDKAKDPVKELQKNPAFKELYRAVKSFIDHRHDPSFLERNPAFVGLRHHYHMLANKVVALEKMIKDANQQDSSDNDDEDDFASGVQRDTWQQNMANDTMPSMANPSNMNAPTPAFPVR